MAYKVTWQSEWNGKLDKDDEPRFFTTYHEASVYMKELIDEIQGNKYLGDRQVVKLYNGRKLMSKWDSMPKKAQVKKARAAVRRKTGGL